MEKKIKKEENKFSLKPLADRVLIKEIEKAKNETRSGIIIPDGVDEDKGAHRGKVVAVGPGKYDDGVLVPMNLKVNDEVLFQWGDKIKIDEEFRLDFSNKISNARKRELKFNLRPNFNCDWTGKKHLESTIIKMREKKLGTGVKEANSQYGTCWITNGVENKKIKLVDLDNYSNSEWFRGRT
jgi:chaperonin GroES